MTTPPDLTLRDYFAAAALPSLINIFADISYERVVESAYQMAESMLAEREKREKERSE